MESGIDNYKWKTFDRVSRKKSKDWYWAVSIIIISLAVTAIIFNNILLAIIILLGISSLAFFASKKPQETEAEIRAEGIRFDKTLYLMENIESFYLTEDRLLLKMKKVLATIIAIPLGEGEANEIKDILNTKIKEEELEEPLFQTILENFGL